MTGSSGWLGKTLVHRLRRDDHDVFGLDPRQAATTDIIGSVENGDLVGSIMSDNKIEAIIHSGALHKPNIRTHSRSDFVSVNVQGTLNLLEKSVEHEIERFVFTSTTSLMISKDIGDSSRTADKATWITEDLTLLRPRNIYGVTKLSAEHMCRLFHEIYHLPMVILRTSRFFPEGDDMAHQIVQSEPNTKVNEFLFRRLSVEDAAEAHVVALQKAPEIGFDTFIISSRPPFKPNDCYDLIRNAPAVVDKYFPEYREVYSRLGWTMFDSIDRVYDPSKAARKLGFICREGFPEKLKELQR